MSKFLTSTSGGVLTPDQAAALAGTDGTPNAGNKYLTAEAIIVTAENKDSVTILKGQPLRVHSSGVGVQRADCFSICRTFAGADTTVGAAVPVRTTGVITLSDWTAVVGSSLLASGGIYFLTVTAGMLSITPPTSGIVQQVGRAISLNVMRISIEIPIFL